MTELSTFLELKLRRIQTAGTTRIRLKAGSPRDQCGKLTVGNGRMHVRQELSFVALLFAGEAKKITTLGTILKTVGR